MLHDSWKRHYLAPGYWYQSWYLTSFFFDSVRNTTLFLFFFCLLHLLKSLTYFSLSSEFAVTSCWSFAQQWIDNCTHIIWETLEHTRQTTKQHHQGIQTLKPLFMLNVRKKKNWNVLVCVFNQCWQFNLHLIWLFLSFSLFYFLYFLFVFTFIFPLTLRRFTCCFINWSDFTLHKNKPKTFLKFALLLYQNIYADDEGAIIVPQIGLCARKSESSERRDTTTESRRWWVVLWLLRGCRVPEGSYSNMMSEATRRQLEDSGGMLLCVMLLASRRRCLRWE